MNRTQIQLATICTKSCSGDEMLSEVGNGLTGRGKNVARRSERLRWESSVEGREDIVARQSRKSVDLLPGSLILKSVG